MMMFFEVASVFGGGMRDKFIFRSIILLLIMANLHGCAAVRKNAAVRNNTPVEHDVVEPGGNDDMAGHNKPLLAVLPIQNYSSKPAPLKKLRQDFVQRLREQGLNLLADDQMEALMARHRLRHVGDVGLEITHAFAEEIGVDGIIITYLEEYRPRGAPMFSLISRLTMTTEIPMVVWMDDVSYSGIETPGLLGLGREYNLRILEKRAMEKLAVSLTDYLDGKPPPVSKHQNWMTRLMDFGPRIHYKSAALQPETRLKVAIIPFLNESGRRFAGELIRLHLLKYFVMDKDDYAVIEPGVVRNVLLLSRIIMPYGLSVVDNDLVFSQLDVDLVLSGSVIDYNNPGGQNMPAIWFDVNGFVRKNYEMVWSSQSINQGDEGLHLFGMGRVFTAGELSSYMTGEIVKMISSSE